VLQSNDKRTVIRNFEGRVFEYPEEPTLREAPLEPAALLD
jgi:hypothetical protein